MKATLLVILLLVFFFLFAMVSNAAKKDCEQNGGEWKYNVIMKMYQCEGD